MCIRTVNKGNIFSEDIQEVKSNITYEKIMEISGEKFDNKTEENNTENGSVELDTLAVLTSHQRKLTEIVDTKFKNFHQTHYYKILFGTTQPAHIISVIAITSVMSLVYTSPSATSKLPQSSPPSAITMFTYLLAFCTHFGSQIWMTFVSGLSLYFSLPRHAFGNVQKVLFPKYFGLNAFLSSVTLIAFNRLNHPWNNEKLIQELILVICFLLELIVRLYAVPVLLKLITAKTAIESKAGVGHEIGYHDPGPLRNCPHYNKLQKAFRSVHLFVAIGNVITLICTALHLQYLSYYFIALTNCQKHVF